LSEATAGTFKHTVFAMQLSKEKCQAIQTPWLAWQSRATFFSQALTIEPFCIGT
jgi:hypothetical protein